MVKKYFWILSLGILSGADISCSNNDESSAIVIHDGLGNWNNDNCKNDMYNVSLVSTRWVQSSTFNTNNMNREVVITKIEFPFRIWNQQGLGDDYSWDGSPGSFELNIIEGLPENSQHLWADSTLFNHDLVTNSIKTIIPTTAYVLRPKSTYTLIMKSKIGIGGWLTSCNSDNSSKSYQYDQTYDFWYDADDGYPFRISVKNR